MFVASVGLLWVLKPQQTNTAKKLKHKIQRRARKSWYDVLLSDYDHIIGAGYDRDDDDDDDDDDWHGMR